MKQSKYTKLKHSVKFVRVLNQPATWIEVNVIEPVEVPKEQCFNRDGINKPVPDLFSNRRLDNYKIKT